MKVQWLLIEFVKDVFFRDQEGTVQFHYVPGNRIWSNGLMPPYNHYFVASPGGIFVDEATAVDPSDYSLWDGYERRGYSRI